jgi:uncharacterized repeat protein (TIGR01451 family)
MKKLFNFILIAVISLLVIVAAANAIGTTANTLIDSTATSVTLSYSGYADVTFNLTTAPQVTKSVGAVYGFNFYNSVTANLYSPTVTSGYTAAGVTLNLFQNIVNISNDTITVSVRTSGNAVSLAGNSGTLANWIFTVTSPTDNLDLNEVTNSWRVKIKPAADALNLSQAGITLNVFMVGFTTPNMQYTGYNNNVYGGYNQFGYGIAATISGPDLVLLSRYSTISSSMPGYTGGVSDLVPGSKVTYTIVVKNQGLATANNVAVVDSIPANTTFFGITAGGNETSVDYKISGVFGAFSLPSSNVTDIRFNKATLAPNTVSTFNYEVTID